MFERDGGGNWNEMVILRASETQTNDLFGFSVAVSGTYAVVGAWDEDGGAGDPLIRSCNQDAFIR